MKQLIKLGIIACFTFTLTACGQKVTTEDLKANKWVIESSEKKDSEADTLASFSDNSMTLTIDPDSFESQATNDWEALGEEYGKELAKAFSLKIGYALDGDKITFTPDENEELVKADFKGEYKVSKEDKKIVLTPTNDEDKEVFTLRPFTKKDSQSSTSKEKASSEKVAEEKKKAEEEKQKLVATAEDALKAAEENPTDETYEAARKAVENVPDVSEALKQRLEATKTNLDNIKYEAEQAAIAQQQAYQEPANETTESGPVLVTGTPPMTEQEAAERQALKDASTQAAIENGIDPSQKPYVPPTHVDDQGREYWFENHDAYKDEPYYVGE